MIADVAHELRTPLSVMQANLEAMQDGVLPLDAEQIASLHEETALLTRLVADLRLLSLAEAGQLTLEHAEVDPAELVSKAAERLRPRVEAKGVQLQVQVPESALPPVLADADRISQVIGNLVGNALRYTGRGRLITVAAGSPSRDKRQAQTVMITVTDSGTGIPAADLPHIFDRFYRADKSRTRTSGGSGLGLAIVRYIVEAHGGQRLGGKPGLPGQRPCRATAPAFPSPCPTNASFRYPGRRWADPQQPFLLRARNSTRGGPYPIPPSACYSIWREIAYLATY